MSTEELLAVLDMSEEEQMNWVWSCFGIARKDALADLAFRLRDEVCKDFLCENYVKALYVVYRRFCKSQEGTLRQNMVPYDHWLVCFVTAIDRIVAARIAKKEKEDE